MRVQAPHELPTIDMAPLLDQDELGRDRDERARAEVAEAIGAACRDTGFFLVTGHGIAAEILDTLEAEARAFFALPEAEKRQIDMSTGGPAWRGFFGLGDELTSGRPDAKEGVYFGTELPADHPRVRAGWPLHGANLWPARPPGLRAAVEAHMAAATRAGHALMQGISLSLDLPADYFASRYTADPTILFRIFHYPEFWPEIWPEPADGTWDGSWGVGAHTDYGLLTLLFQDDAGGLEVESRDGWIAVPPQPGVMVCNIGDMLDKLTGGLYRSTLHRVMNRSGRGRLSFPLFFDPDFAATIEPIPGLPALSTRLGARWDGADLSELGGSYGDYLIAKVAKVFPELGRAYLARGDDGTSQ